MVGIREEPVTSFACDVSPKALSLDLSPSVSCSLSRRFGHPSGKVIRRG